MIKIIEKIVKTWETTIEVTTCNGREKADPSVSKEEFFKEIHFASRCLS